MPENYIIYIIQTYMTVKNNKKIFYCEYQILGQVIEAVNPPDNIETYVFKDRGQDVLPSIQYYKW